MNYLNLRAGRRRLHSAWGAGRSLRRHTLSRLELLPQKGTRAPAPLEVLNAPSEALLCIWRYVYTSCTSENNKCACTLSVFPTAALCFVFFLTAPIKSIRLTESECLYAFSSGNLRCDTNKHGDGGAASPVRLLWLHVGSLSQQAASEVFGRYQTVAGLELQSLRNIKQSKQTPDMVWWAAVFQNIIWQEEGWSRIRIRMRIRMRMRTFALHGASGWDEWCVAEGFYSCVDEEEASEIVLVNVAFVRLPGQSHCGVSP